MVTFFQLLVFLLTCGSFSFVTAQETLVEASINQNQGLVDHPINGVVTITHLRSETVNTSSFHVEGSPLAASLVKEVPFGEGNTIVSFYNFSLPPKPKGLYVLGPIDVEVGGKRFQSSAVSYEVKPSSAVSRLGDEGIGSSPVLELQAYVDGSPPFYPGQRVKLVYQISYNQSIELTKSDLPLLHTTDFKKVGDEQVDDTIAKGMNIQSIIQEVEFSRPGSFHFGPSSIQGNAYFFNRLGQKIYYDKPLKAEAPGMDIVINPFPFTKQPASFNGSIGPLEGTLKMTTSPSLRLGDEIELELTISGPTNLAEVFLPLLKCQPGFSGFFLLDDMPPHGKIRESAKEFKITLRPISQFVQAVPSIELSSFNPEKANYYIWRSKPIPLKVSPSTIEEVYSTESTLIESNLVQDLVANAEKLIPAIEGFSPIQVMPKDLNSRPIRTALVFFLIPVGLMIVILQLNLNRWWEQMRRSIKEKSSQDLLQEAFEKKDPLQTARLIEQAIQLRLKEEVSSEPKDLNEVEQFLMLLETIQYGKTGEPVDLILLRRESNRIYNLI